MNQLAGNVVCAAFIVSAAVIAALGQDGWGWFLFGALVTYSWQE